LMVANTFERRHKEAFIGAREYTRVTRPELPVKFMGRLEEWGAPH
jgi:hypothetical protein